MKKIIILLIKKYQAISFKSHYACKYIPTCSNYAIEALEEYGTVYGLYLTIKRILRCNPFSKGGIDPVPKRRKIMKNKKILKLIILVLLFITTTGCLKRDNMEDINIITTSYPLEYVLTKLYGKNSIVNSIYPDGVNITEYKLTEKKLKDLSKQNLFVYNGLSNDKEIALNLLNRNSNLLIMDSNLGMEYTYSIEELWLNPSNLLMISQNIKNGLEEIISSKYIIDEIDNQYETLKLELSELDADMKNVIQNSPKNTLITVSPSLQFLSKYGLNTIYVKDDKSFMDALSSINKSDIEYVYILENDNETEYLKKLKNETDIKVITIDKIDNLTDEQRDKKDNYVSIMKDNIELIRKGLE